MKTRRYHQDTYDYFSLPLYVKENTLLAIGKVDDRPDYNYAEECELHWYAPIKGKEAVCHIPDTQGNILQTIRVVVEDEEVIAQDEDVVVQDENAIAQGEDTVVRDENVIAQKENADSNIADMNYMGKPLERKLYIHKADGEVRVVSLLSSEESQL